MQFVSATLTGGTVERAPVSTPMMVPSTKYVRLRCPECTASLGAIAEHALGQAHQPIPCAKCSTPFVQDSRIWLALRKNRRRYFDRFIQDYEIVRRAEGRGSADPTFYLSLPYRDRTNRNAWQWAIRARTYNYIERKILPTVAGKPLSILDLGAGNGWLSYRLASLGHRPIAIDLQTNVFDGLGAAVHYQSVLPMVFPRFQAEIDWLPLETGQFDCAIFNASFHYSESYDLTLAEAIRCLRPGGTLVIADSPTYQREKSGQQMVAERRKLFQRRFGLSSDSLVCREYITRETLLALETTHRLRWTTHHVWYGLRWACRPLVAKLKRRREPSQFRIYTAQVKTA
jgi:SAM-dependent methyltransferase